MCIYEQVLVKLNVFKDLVSRRISKRLFVPSVYPLVVKRFDSLYLDRQFGGGGALHKDIATFVWHAATVAPLNVTEDRQCKTICEKQLLGFAFVSEK